MRVLVVEDESGLAEVIARRLRREGMAVDLALDGRAALAKALVVDYDAVVLDRDLPGIHGDEVCVTLVATERPPRILILTASGEVCDRISGLDLGADDYLPKPFSPASSSPAGPVRDARRCEASPPRRCARRRRRLRAGGPLDDGGRDRRAAGGRRLPGDDVPGAVSALRRGGPLDRARAA